MVRNATVVIAELNRAIGRNEYSGVEREIERDGFALLRPRSDKDNADSRKLLRELETFGYTLHPADKGLIIDPPVQA